MHPRLFRLYQRNLLPEYLCGNQPQCSERAGDVGNDIKVYGSKLYIVVNVSNKIEVLDARTAKRITSIPLQNCRYLAFKDGKAYASSYAGPVAINPKAPKGKVVEIDTTSLSIQREVVVGYQPEDMEIVGNQLFVANSGAIKLPIMIIPFL